MKKCVGCIGCGVMGSALMRIVAQTIDPSEVLVYDRTPEKIQELKEGVRIIGASSGDEVARSVQYLFLAVKPQVLGTTLKTIREDISSETVVISIAAGVSLESLKSFLPSHDKIVRLMPNMPLIIGEGMMGMVHTDSLTANEVSTCLHLLSKTGVVEITTEPLMDAVTAISGSGPAYAFIFIEALADAAVMMGMPRNKAYVYAAQTIKGSAAYVLESGKHPGELKDLICSPGGTTIAAVGELEDRGFRSAVMHAALASFKRSKELSRS